MQNHHHFYIRVQEIVKKTNVWYEIVEKNSSLFLTTYLFWVLSYQTLVFLTILWHGVKKLMRYPPCTNFSHVTNLLKRPTFDMKLTKKNRLYKKPRQFCLKPSILIENGEFCLNPSIPIMNRQFWSKINILDSYTWYFPNLRPKQHILKRKQTHKLTNYFTLMKMSLL